MSWDALNTSELVLLATMVNTRVHRGIPRKVLIALLDEEEYDLPSREVDDARDDIFQMVDRYWSQVESLISCPMKTRRPRACYGCLDIQVAECSLLNRKLIKTAKEK